MPSARPPAIAGRIIHTLLAAGVIAAATIALVLGKDHRLFPTHATIGLILAALVLARLILTAAGKRPAAPRAPHRRLAAPLATTLFTLILGLAATGILMQRGHHTLAPLHAIMAYALVAALFAHIGESILSARRARLPAPSHAPGAHRLS